MLALDPPSLMQLRWADDVLRYPDGSGCILRLTVTFPDHGKASRAAAGWYVCLEQLTHALDGAAPPWKPPDRWWVVHRGYVERLAPRHRPSARPRSGSACTARRVPISEVRRAGAPGARVV
jgi:hypothetical protein